MAARGAVVVCVNVFDTGLGIVTCAEAGRMPQAAMAASRIRRLSMGSTLFPIEDGLREHEREREGDRGEQAVAGRVVECQNPFSSPSSWTLCLMAASFPPLSIAESLSAWVAFLSLRMARTPFSSAARNKLSLPLMSDIR